MKLKYKLLVGATLLTAIPALVAGFLVSFEATETSRAALETQARNQLVSIRETRHAQISDYFGTIRDQVITYSNDRMIIDAMREFSVAFGAWRAPPDEQLAQQKQALVGYYKDDFSAQYMTQNSGRAPAVDQWLAALDPEAVRAQYHYIGANTNPLGAKDELLAAADGSNYSTLHARYHPHIREFLSRFGYYDIFLVEPDSGDIVYSVFKELDYGTSLKDGPHAGSGLGIAFAKGLALGERDAVVLEDFAPYGPSYEGAASFIASPIFDGKKRIGVLIFQMPVDRINAVMTSAGRWAEVGLGASGETYLVGPDKLMRSQSRFMIEDAKGFSTALLGAGTDNQLVHGILARESVIGLMPADTPASAAALAGKTGFQIIDDYRGVSVLSAYAPLDVVGLHWAILAEIDAEEALAAAVTLRHQLMLMTILIVAVTAALAVVVAGISATAITRPVLRLAQTISTIDRDSDLSLRTGIDRDDELGDMARSFDSMVATLQRIVGRVADSTRHLASSAEELYSVSEATSRSVEQQRSQTETVATAMHEMTATVQDVARSAAAAASAAAKADEQAGKGGELVANVVASISALARAIEGASGVIERVEKDSADIGSVIGVIRGIAEQTNLLALNAAIEAARAGEQGRGFAVVADEVRTLAGRTQTATHEIEKMIERLQGGAREAVSVMGTSQGEARSVVERAESAGEALQAITSAFATINDMNTQIASAAEEQSAVAEQINRDVVVINDGAAHAEEGTRRTTAASHALSDLAAELQDLVARFRVDTEPGRKDSTDAA